jgi:hypothetical protein
LPGFLWLHTNKPGTENQGQFTYMGRKFRGQVTGSYK